MFAWNFNLRRYSEVGVAQRGWYEVGWCWLTVSKPRVESA